MEESGLPENLADGDLMPGPWSPAAALGRDLPAPPRVVLQAGLHGAVQVLPDDPSSTARPSCATGRPGLPKVFENKCFTAAP